MHTILYKIENHQSMYKSKMMTLLFATTSVLKDMVLSYDLYLQKNNWFIQR